MIRVPNWLGDLVLAIPVLRALRAARPEDHLSLLCPCHFSGLLKALKIADEIIPLPHSPWGAMKVLWQLRQRSVEGLYFLTRSRKNDLESFCIRPGKSYAIAMAKKRYFHVSNTWKPPLDENLHQTQRMELWLKDLGILSDLDLQPIPNPGVVPKSKIALITGSTNMPFKRWSIHHWRELMQHLLYRYPQHKVILIGSAKDALITRQVAQGFDHSRVENLAGQTDLVRLMQALRACQLVIGNDTGALHLANALGVPTIGLYGPTNPEHSRPIFEAPCEIVQPDSLNPSEMKSMDSISAKDVLEAAARMLPRGR
jgi:heptosyltransferase-2